MNAGKSTSLLQSNHNYIDRGLKTILFTPKVDADMHEGKIHSRIGLEKSANIFDADFNFQDFFKSFSMRLLCLFPVITVVPSQENMGEVDWQLLFLL